MASPGTEDHQQERCAHRQGGPSGVSHLDGDHEKDQGRHEASGVTPPAPGRKLRLFGLLRELVRHYPEDLLTVSWDLIVDGDHLALQNGTRPATFADRSLLRDAPALPGEESGLPDGARQRRGKVHC